MIYAAIELLIGLLKALSISIYIINYYIPLYVVKYDRTILGVHVTTYYAM